MSETKPSTLHGESATTGETDRSLAWQNKYVARFINHASGKIIDEENEIGEWCDEDREGRLLIGTDERGSWWGTESAAWILSEQDHVVEVWGYIGPDPYVGHFMGTVDEVQNHCKCHGIKITVIQSSKTGVIYDGYSVVGYY